MTKKLLLATLLLCSLCACGDEEGEALKQDTADLIGRYGVYVDEHKDEIVEGMTALEQIAKDAMDEATAKREQYSK